MRKIWIYVLILAVLGLTAAENYSEEIEQDGLPLTQSK